MNNNINNSFNRLALDVSGLNDLKRDAAQGSEKSIKKVAEQFEALFVNMMMQSMRKSVPDGELFNSSGTKLFTSMFDQQIAQQSAGKGFGLADMLMKQMLPKTKLENDNISEDSLNKIKKLEAPNQLNPLFGQSLFADSTANMTPKALAQIIYQTTKLNPENNTIPLQSKVSQTQVRPISDVANGFIEKWLEPAKSVSKKSGIPYEIIIAQAALETGWGVKPIKTNNGEDSHNYFGIKVNKSWQGKQTEVMTSEYIDGKNVKLKDRFKVYNNPTEALEDYTNLLTKNERYQSIINANNAQEAAKILQDNNYATDPNYANKLIQLINRIQSVENSTSKQSNSSI